MLPFYEFLANILDQNTRLVPKKLLDYQEASICAHKTKRFVAHLGDVLRISPVAVFGNRVILTDQRGVVNQVNQGWFLPLRDL